MKYKILEKGRDALNNLTLEVEFIDGARSSKKTFNFDPELSKADISKLVSEGSNLPEITEEEATKETACTERLAEFTSEIDKEVEITKLETKK